MNISVIDTIKTVVAYIESKAVGSRLEDHVFTGPQEERTNKYKEFCTINYVVNPTQYELGDSQSRTEIELTITFGYRDDVTNVSGMEKEIGDTFFATYSRYLRSREFRRYMHSRGITIPPGYIDDGKLDEFAPEFEGIRKYTIVINLWTFIETLEDIP